MNGSINFRLLGVDQTRQFRCKRLEVHVKHLVGLCYAVAESNCIDPFSLMFDRVDHLIRLGHRPDADATVTFRVIIYGSFQRGHHRRHCSPSSDAGLCTCLRYFHDTDLIVSLFLVTCDKHFHAITAYGQFAIVRNGSNTILYTWCI